jgi:hypothetical protein
MTLDFMNEPSLEFGGGGTHIDVRFGLLENGPLDRDTDHAPTSLGIGLVGTNETIEATLKWLDVCRKRIEGKRSRLSNLFPPFPGFTKESCFHSSVVVNDRWCATVNKREIDSLLAVAPAERVVESAVDLFLQTAQPMFDKGGPSVLICVPPQDLLTMLDARSAIHHDILDEEIDEGSADSNKNLPEREPYFHDVLKARAMRLGAPVQMVRPHTISGTRLRPAHGKTQSSVSLQDEATRAWNFHTALYYKAGGVPWRILRKPTDLSACFVGVSFFKSLEGDKLLTSVAQVFNERGEGVIVRGAQAELGKDDRVPHLQTGDATALLKMAISAYRGEHKTIPARIVVHKSSRMNPAETEGFQSAASEERIDSIDLISVKRSYTRLFRESVYPPLRGTHLQFDSRSGIIYMRGSVDFFRTYPGLYVPRPIEYYAESSEATPAHLAAEMFALSKLNWNNTQFDGGEPITVRAARRVGDILKCIEANGVQQGAYRFYM